jgi:hypothetical protein
MLSGGSHGAALTARAPAKPQPRSTAFSSRVLFMSFLLPFHRWAALAFLGSVDSASSLRRTAESVRWFDHHTRRGTDNACAERKPDSEDARSLTYRSSAAAACAAHRSKAANDV